MKSLKVAVLSAALLGPTLALAATWEIDSSHSHTSFTVKHLMVSKVRGEFGKTTGTIELDEKDMTKSTVTASVDVNSINTREAKRDAHLKAADFFEAEKHPAMTFKSKKVTKAGKGGLKVVGDLTIKGVTKEVTLNVVPSAGEVKDPWGNIKRGFSATTKINRKDFGLSWNAPLEAGGVVVGEEVDVELEIEATKQVQKT